MKNLFFKLAKIAEQDDGTLYVEGVASSESVDAQGEIIKAAAISGAIPDFMKYGTGALREMHQASAAGTVDSAVVEDGVTKISATVVDPVAIKKVQTGVYKGLSIGGRALERDSANPKIITKCSLVEVSLVDRPANPDAVLSLFKVEGAPEADAAEGAEAAEPKGDSEAGAADEDAAVTVKADGAELSAADRLAASAAALAKLADQAVPASALAPFETSLRKSIYQVSSLGDCLSTLAYLARSTKLEAEREKDGSRIPARLLAAVKDIGQIMIDLTAEEVAELLASAEDTDSYAYADAALDMVKAAQAAEQDAIAKGEAPAPRDLTDLRAKAVEALAISAAPDAEALNKMTGERDAALAKVASHDEAMSKLAEQVEGSLSKLTQRLADLEKTAMPPKTAGASVAISKAQDAPGLAASAETGRPSEDDVRKALDSMTPDERAFLLTKAALSRPHPISL